MTDPRSGQGQRWKESVPADRAWKPRTGMNKRTRSAEQDRAAGGARRRAVKVGEGRFARASIALRLYGKRRRVHAYLRWSQDGRTRERHVGEVDGVTRAENLKAAWAMAHSAGLATTEEVPSDSWASSPETRAVMRANKGRDTKPERLLRSALHRKGLRYRVGTNPLPDSRRTADVVFPKARVAVFVDGCFWHGCPDHHRPSTKRTEFWTEKIEGNKARDTETTAMLRAEGWEVVRVWEHEDPHVAADRVTEILRQRSASSGRGT